MYQILARIRLLSQSLWKSYGACGGNPPETVLTAGIQMHIPGVQSRAMARDVRLLIQCVRKGKGGKGRDAPPAPYELRSGVKTLDRNGRTDKRFDGRHEYPSECSGKGFGASALSRNGIASPYQLTSGPDRYLPPAICTNRNVQSVTRPTEHPNYRKPWFTRSIRKSHRTDRLWYPVHWRNPAPIVYICTGLPGALVLSRGSHTRQPATFLIL